jgi:hypothetical protein
MTDEITNVVKILGHEWCLPLGDARLLDYVAVGCGEGHIVLCRVEQDVYSGEIHKVMLRKSDLDRATE